MAISKVDNHENGDANVLRSDRNDNDDQDRVKDICGQETSDNEAVVSSESKAAYTLLCEAMELFTELQRGSILAAKSENLEKTSKIFNLQPSIILYAYNHGLKRAHDTFFCREDESRSGSTSSAST